MAGQVLRRAIVLLVPFLAGVIVGPTLVDGSAQAVRSVATSTSAPTVTATFAPPSATATPAPSDTPSATATPTATPTPTPTPTPTATSTSTSTPTPERRSSVLEDGTLLTIYGRAFAQSPVLGLLGSYRNFEHMEREIQQRFYPNIKAHNGGKPIVPVAHLIYAMAIPCSPNDDCLLYLEGVRVDVLKDYIEPAGRRGWEVILDSQIGRSDPVAQVKRMIDRGYLKYEHVHVALDPEFHSYPGRNNPGTPVGVLEAAAINEAQRLLDDYVRAQGLKRKKMLMVHQFGDAEVNDGVPHMIANKKSLRTFPSVELVLDADGFGGPDSKASKYNRMLDSAVYPFVRFRGIKLFTPNPEAPNHYDKPQLEWPALFGKKDTPGGVRIRWAPDVIVIA